MRDLACTVCGRIITKKVLDAMKLNNGLCECGRPFLNNGTAWCGCGHEISDHKGKSDDEPLEHCTSCMCKMFYLGNSIDRTEIPVIPDRELERIMNQNRGLTSLHELVGTWYIDVETWTGTETEVKIFKTLEHGDRKYFAKMIIPKFVSSDGKEDEHIARGGNVTDLLEKMIKIYVDYCNHNYKSQ